MGSSGGNKSAQQPPKAAEPTSSIAAIKGGVKRSGKDEPEYGAIGSDLGGTGNSMDVGGGRKKGQGPKMFANS